MFSTVLVGFSCGSRIHHWGSLQGFASGGDTSATVTEVLLVDKDLDLDQLGGEARAKRRVRLIFEGPHTWKGHFPTERNCKRFALPASAQPSLREGSGTPKSSVGKVRILLKACDRTSSPVLVRCSEAVLLGRFKTKTVSLG